MNFRFRNTAARLPSRRQQGNTLVGIIIGLVIGLVIAVIVALAITKGATPFTDKSGRNGKSNEPTAGQVADPNKPMYGNKEPAREAAKDFVREAKPETKAEAKPETRAETQPEPKAPARVEVKPEPKAPAADPLQAVVDRITPPPKTAAAAAAKPATAPAAAGDEKYTYYLQAGAFREIGDAESARAKLALLGFEASISDRSTDTGVLHRVRMGPFNQVESMNRVRSKLSENGVDVAVVRNQK
ncbi:SPOR domain-containing protein [Rugamonas sp. CCM 8940]|uniref:SPOR domain-containing protein n=1 Tax=Rugamonas sp. CCM 8940 TaxID=2765359 RepID=UPI0018F66485|nr:SPOR domain-containing protein [Rugamonas sp. CCM 8940]MBJ7314206.1 SPOR domain-containing protein [Rugamonas sp. CCM 8940]